MPQLKRFALSIGLLCLVCALLMAACARLPAETIIPQEIESETAGQVTPSDDSLVQSTDPVNTQKPIEETPTTQPTQAEQVIDSPASLTPTPEESPPPDDLPLPEPQFEFWNVQQLLLVFKASNLDYKASQPLTADDLPGLPFLAKEAVWLDFTPLCWGCWGRIFTFAAPEDLQETLRFYQDQNAQEADQQSWLLVDHNALIQIDSRARERLVQSFENAMQTVLPASLLVPTDYGIQAYESWDEYYPLDRGQQVDAERGMGQRTYNRWEPPNYWQYGQATWRYQDPGGSQDPPPYFPSEYQGERLTYFFLYPCESNVNPDLARDCLEWRMFIEMGAVANQNTEFQNWAKGGWQWKVPKPIKWEVFYQPDAFIEGCTKNSIRRQVSDEQLQDPAIKLPLSVRLPKVVGVRQVSSLYCTVHFNSYLLRAGNIREANLVYLTTESLEKTYDPALDQYLIKAINRYYSYWKDVDGEAVYQQTGYEIYWMRQVKADDQLKNGFEAFWWYSWKTPPEENRDEDGDPAWSGYQWCYQDFTHGPAGLGRLVCELP